MLPIPRRVVVAALTFLLAMGSGAETADWSTAAPSHQVGSFSKEAANALQERGYAIFRNALPLAVVDDLKRRASAVFAGAEGHLQRPQVPDGWEGRGFLLRCLACVPKESVASPMLTWLNAAARVVERAIVASTKSSSKERFVFAGHSDLHANTTKAWHRDAHSKPNPWHTYNNTSHRLFRLIVYLESHSHDDGALLVVPGSHLDQSLQPPPQLDDTVLPHAPKGNDPRGMRRNVSSARSDLLHKHVQSLRPSLGDALVIDHRTYHRGGDVHGQPGPRHLLQYSFGAEGSFTDRYRTTNTINVRAERAKCPTSFQRCLCFDAAPTHVSHDDACGEPTTTPSKALGCGRCGSAPTRRRR